MLDDRPYMRPEEPNFRPPLLQQPWSGWAILLTINLAVFILQLLMDSNSLSPSKDFRDSFVGNYLAMPTENFSWLLPFQLFTYQFLHGSVGHLLLNGIALFFVGRLLEPVIGRRELIALYLVSGVAGGLFQLLFAFLLPSHFAGPPMIGASGAVFGFIGVYSRLFPRQEAYFLLFLVLPVRMKWKWIFWGACAISILHMLYTIQTFSSDGTAHAAHLGGLLYGAFFVAFLVRRGGFLSLFSLIPKVKIVSDSPVSGSDASRRRDWRKPNMVDADEVSGQEFMSRDVDPILEKISKHGIHSLTENERKILEKARSKM